MMMITLILFLLYKIALIWQNDCQRKKERKKPEPNISGSKSVSLALDACIFNAVALTTEVVKVENKKILEITLSYKRYHVNING